MSISLNNEETQDWDNMKPHLREGILKIVETLGIKNPRIIAKPGSGKGDNFMANMYKVKITDLDNAEAKSVNLMMKAVLNVQMNDRRKSHYFIDAHHRERLAYTQLFPKMKQIEDECNLKDDERFVLPKYYASGCEELKEWIILEDISVSGFKMFNKFEEVDRDHAWAIIKEFAKFHALNFAFRQRDKAEYNRIAEEFVKLKPDVYDDYITTVFKMAAAALKDEDEIYKNKVEEFSLRAKKKWFEMITYPNDDQYRILCHFDCWVNNFMYRYENGKVVDARIIDWQEMKVSPPVLDLVYMLSVTTGEKFRSKHLTEAIDFYYESFSDAMKRLDCDVDVLYPKSVFDEHLKEIQPIGLLIAIVTWPFTMTEEKDVIDLGDYVRNCENSEHYIKFSKVAKDRFINLVKDFARYELI